MGVQTSEVSICNQALGWLGAESITSLSDRSTTAELCKNNYPILRDAVMTEMAWTFATDRATSVTADLDAWGHNYKHSVPPNWLQVLRVYRKVTNESKLDSMGWVREGNFIITKEATVYLWGIKQVTATSYFSEAFTQCLAARIAADLCIPITQNVNQQGALWQLYGAKLEKAAMSDGLQGSNEVIQSEALIDARWGSG